MPDVVTSPRSTALLSRPSARQIICSQTPRQSAAPQKGGRRTEQSSEDGVRAARLRPMTAAQPGRIRQQKLGHSPGWKVAGQTASAPPITALGAKLRSTHGGDVSRRRRGAPRKKRHAAGSVKGGRGWRTRRDSSRGSVTPTPLLVAIAALLQLCYRVAHPVILRRQS